jgi:hypothetical protein
MGAQDTHDRLGDDYLCATTGGMKRSDQNCRKIVGMLNRAFVAVGWNNPESHDVRAIAATTITATILIVFITYFGSIYFFVSQGPLCRAHNHRFSSKAVYSVLRNTVLQRTDILEG